MIPSLDVAGGFTIEIPELLQLFDTILPRHIRTLGTELESKLSQSVNFHGVQKNSSLSGFALTEAIPVTTLCHYPITQLGSAVSWNIAVPVELLVC